MDLRKIKRMETHSHSMYSNLRLIDSINRPKEMLLTCADLGLSGCVLTDHESLSGHVEWITFAEELKKEGKVPQDFKAGLGNEIYLVDKRERGIKYYHYILIAKNDLGRRALKELSSKAWYNVYVDRRLERVPTLKSELEEIVRKYPNSLIATTACIGGECAQLVFKWDALEKEGAPDDKIYEAKKAIVDFIDWNKSLFGDDFYLEVAPSKLKDQLIFNERIKPVARATNTKMIYATDAHYLREKDREMHKAYLNSKEGEREVDAFYKYSHFQDNNEAFENLQPIFDEEDFKEMCANSMEIYDKIEEYHLFRNPIIPRVEVEEETITDNIPSKFPVLNSLKNGNAQERYWLFSCLEKLKELKLFNDEYLSRLETEADVISTIGEKLGNCMYEYFNTFRHYIDLFWECGSLVGPGRGSSCGFLSNYLLGITQLDPIKWNLNWWRFLNKERVELPELYWASKSW